MRKITLTLFVLLSCSCLYAQQDSDPVNPPRIRIGDHPLFYLATSTGINNNSGFLGMSFEKPLNKKRNYTIEGGLGLSTWGLKLSTQTRYYFKSHKKGWALGAGVTFNTGKHDVGDFSSAVPSRGGHLPETVSVILLPQFAGDLAVYHYWPIGSGSNFFMSFGWSLCVTSDKYRQTSGDPIDPSATNNVISDFAPGGPVLALGLSFGCYRHQQK